MEREKSELDIPATVRALLSRHNADVGRVYDGLVEAVEAHHSRMVSGMLALKARESATRKGELWEEVCRLWLLAEGSYEEVWRLRDVPPSVKRELGMRRNEDRGIDLVGVLKVARETSHVVRLRRRRGEDEVVPQTTLSKYVAVQCKYRKRSDLLVPWDTLATFVGYYVVTGPWAMAFVMTNCKGVAREVYRVTGDRNVCGAGLRATNRGHWLRMAGVEGGRMLEGDGDRGSGASPSPPAPTEGEDVEVAPPVSAPTPPPRPTRASKPRAPRAKKVFPGEGRRLMEQVVGSEASTLPPAAPNRAPRRRKMKTADDKCREARLKHFAAEEGK